LCAKFQILMVLGVHFCTSKRKIWHRGAPYFTSIGVMWKHIFGSLSKRNTGMLPSRIGLSIIIINVKNFHRNLTTNCKGSEWHLWYSPFYTFQCPPTLKGKGKGKGLDTCYSATYMSRLVTSSALQSRKWQLIGMSCQLYEGRLPLTSKWRKSSNMTVGQSSLISLTHYWYDWHPGIRCGWTCNQLTSKVNGGITGSRLRWSILT